VLQLKELRRGWGVTQIRLVRSAWEWNWRRHNDTEGSRRTARGASPGTETGMQKAHMVRGAPWAVAGRRRNRAESTAHYTILVSFVNDYFIGLRGKDLGQAKNGKLEGRN